MSGISSQAYSTNAEGVGTPLMYSIWTDVEKFVITWLGIAGQHSFILHWLVRLDFFGCQSGVFAI
jgi:hypothetical protein